LKPRGPDDSTGVPRLPEEPSVVTHGITLPAGLVNPQRQLASKSPWYFLFPLQTKGIEICELASTHSYRVVQNAVERKAATGGWGPAAAPHRQDAVRKKAAPPLVPRHKVFFALAPPGLPGPPVHIWPGRGPSSDYAKSLPRRCRTPAPARDRACKSQQVESARTRIRPCSRTVRHRAQGAAARAKASWRPPTTSSASWPLPPKRSSLTFPSWTAWNHLSAVPAA
jgi:hypothetical protein